MKTLTLKNTQTIAIKPLCRKVANSKLNPAKLFLITSLIVTPMISETAYAFENAKVQDNDTIQLSDNDKEGLGFGTGVIIGAILGGPIGAILTGVTGTLIAKNHNAQENASELQATLNNKENEYTVAIQDFRRKLQRAEQNHQLELTAMEQNFDQKYQQASQLQAENLLMSLQFPTGSSELQPHYQDQIIALSEMLQQSPNLVIDLSGYTDKQGSQNRNQSLSVARVNTVKNALVDQGVRETRIQSFAYGEKAPVVATSDREVSFYDRRVVIKLRNDAAQVANNY